MDFEQRLRASMVAPKPGPMFTARVLARIARGAARRRSRFILMGTVLVVGAAAGVLAWRISDMRQQPVESAAIPAVSGAEPVAGTPALQSVANVQEPGAPQSPTEPVPDGISPQFTVLVMPLRQDAQNTAGRGPLQALYAATLDELRKIPGLTLRVPGDSNPGIGGQADYVLTIASLATTVTPSGGIVMRATDGTTRCTENGGPEMLCNANNPLGQLNRPRGISTNIEYSTEGVINSFGGLGAGAGSPDSVVWVELKVESPRTAPSRYTFPVGTEDAAEQLGCEGPYGKLALECLPPARLAARQIQSLRLLVFPPDAAFQQRLLAQLGSTGQDPAQGMVLSELLQGLTRDGGARVDAETLRALSRYLAGQPASTRASAWSTLQQVSHPALVALLVDSLRQDRDRQVRLSALSSLSANYSGDPLVHRALEDIDREEPDPIVRAVVRRALYGPSQWRADVLAALGNSELPYEARLAPLLVNTTTGTPQQDFEMSRVRQSVLQEPQVLGPLLALVREHLRDAEHTQATGNALAAVGSVEDPAVFDLFLQLARETSWPFPFSNPISTWLLNHRNDPRVREVLPQLESTLPSHLLRRMGEISELSGDPARGGGAVSYGSGSGPIIEAAPPPPPPGFPLEIPE